jgi:erythronate-4-phosphate dehydrogenase
MPNALFINAGRGGLVTKEALHRMADKGVTLVLDTWPDEPQVPQTLLSKVAVATPHIAGYTGTAKTNATDFLINPCLRALDLKSSLEMNNPKETEQVSVEVPADSDIGGLMKVMEAVSRVAQDDSDFRRAWSKSPTPDNFEVQRTNYRLRSQYSDLIISANSTSSELHRLLGAAGFGGVS